MPALTVICVCLQHAVQSPCGLALCSKVYMHATLSAHMLRVATCDPTGVHFAVSKMSWNADRWIIIGTNLSTLLTTCTVNSGMQEMLSSTIRVNPSLLVLVVSDNC